MIELITAENNRKTCNVCNYRIRKGLKYIEFWYKNRYGWVTFKICEVCLWSLINKINPEDIKEELKNRVIEKL